MKDTQYKNVISKKAGTGSVPAFNGFFQWFHDSCHAALPLFCLTAVSHDDYDHSQIMWQSNG
jgi:hypothetical protein